MRPVEGDQENIEGKGKKCPRSDQINKSERERVAGSGRDFLIAYASWEVLRTDPRVEGSGGGVGELGDKFTSRISRSHQRLLLLTLKESTDVTGFQVK